METYTSSTQLSSLTEWSKQHIREVFEAQSDEQSMKAVAGTFTEDLEAYINGSPITRQDIQQLVLSLRKGSSGGLSVQWQHAVEVPRDPSTNRDGSFGGMYIIRGIQKMLPGHSKPVEFERHKTVTVRIASLSSNPEIDSRRIVSLTFVASDIRVNRQATL